MTNETKIEIQRLLKIYISQYPSQSAAVKKLKSVSEATVIQILKDNWDLISVEMWTRVGKQVGWNAKGDWTMVDTKDYDKVCRFLADAQAEQNVYAICAPEGSGKTSSVRHYASTYQQVFHVVCAEYFNMKYLLRKMLEAMSIESASMTVPEMMETVVDAVNRMSNVLFVWDEFDKLKDPVIYFFITLYNELEDKCGMVVMGTPFLEARIKKGVRLNKKGFREIYSRIGRKYIYLNGTSKAEVKAICEANGIADPADIAEAFNDYEGDLRRLKKKIHNIKKRNDDKDRSNAA